MKNLFSSVYLVSKIASAIVTVLSIALFTRLVSHETYGQYLVGFAFAFILYSTTAQWIVSAHFGTQSPKEAATVAAGAVGFSGVSLLIGLLLLGIVTAVGLIGADIAVPTGVLLLGFTVYFLANELGRAQLLVGPVTTAATMRSVGSLVLGGLALWHFKSAGSLLVAVGAAHIIAGVPIYVSLSRGVWAGGFVWPKRSVYARLWRYGWPLILAGAAASVAASIDRLLLEHFYGPALVGPYGATLDFIKQSFVIVGETVAVSYVSRAKYLHGDAMHDRANASLRQAFVTAAFLAAFGILFYLLLGDKIFSLLLHGDYQAATPLVPLLAVANACLLLRSYYFAQTIYFTNSVRLELISTVVALVVSLVFSWWLIPIYSIAGAAVAYTIAQFAALGVFLLSPKTRELMPVDARRLFSLVVVAAATLAVGEVIRQFLGAAALAANLVLLAAVSATLLVRWDMFDAGRVWNGVGRVLREARLPR
ncbi:MAG: lipopolysaccharide biosynthesis protein [Devosia sp.]